MVQDLCVFSLKTSTGRNNAQQTLVTNLHNSGRTMFEINQHVKFDPDIDTNVIFQGVGVSSPLVSISLSAHYPHKTFQLYCFVSCDTIFDL